MAADESEQSPWTRPGFVAAAIVVALVLVLAAILGVNALREDDGEEPAPPVATGTPEPTPSETAGVAGGESVCGLEGVELEGTVTTAPEAEWELIGTTAAPGSPTAGPGVVGASGVRYCFQHTPEGAVLAAANVFAMSAEPTLLHPMMEALAAEGPGRDAVLEATEGVTGSAPPVRVQISGFNVLSYNGQEAVVDVAFSGSNGTKGAIAYELVWEDGDWKITLRPDGSTPNPPVQLPDHAGYIPWAGA